MIYKYIAFILLLFSQSKDHNHIFASFSRGWIGIWNVNDGVNVSRTIVDGVPHYLPLNYFCLGEQYPNREYIAKSILKYYILL